MGNFFEWLNGKKTNIGMVLVLLAQFLIRVVVPELDPTNTLLPNIATWMNDLGLALGGVGLAHKGIKARKTNDGQ